MDKKLLTCDTCGAEVDIVHRVVIDKDYNRANARALYNCTECFEEKNKVRLEKEDSKKEDE